MGEATVWEISEALRCADDIGERRLLTGHLIGLPSDDVFVAATDLTSDWRAFKSVRSACNSRFAHVRALPAADQTRDSTSRAVKPASQATGHAMRTLLAAAEGRLTAGKVLPFSRARSGELWPKAISHFACASRLYSQGTTR